MDRHSGKFVLRIPIDMHKKLVDMAKSNKISLNQACVNLLKIGLAGKEKGALFAKSLEKVILKLKERFDGGLCGIVLFGSYATGDASSESDVDLMIIMERDVPIERGLYRWWDENIVWEERAALSPHFVGMIDDADGAGGLWLEVATSGKIIYQRDSVLNDLFYSVEKLISDGRVRKYISNGHSYWVWR